MKKFALKKYVVIVSYLCATCAIIELLPAAFDVFDVIHSWSKADALTADSVALVASACSAEDMVLRGHQTLGLTGMYFGNTIANDEAPDTHQSGEQVSCSTSLRGSIAGQGVQGGDSSHEIGPASRECHVNRGALEKQRPSDRVHANGVASGSCKAGSVAAVSYTARAVAQQSRAEKAPAAFKRWQRPRLPKCRFCLRTFISEHALATHLARNPACKHQNQSQRFQRSAAPGPTCNFCLRAFISQHALAVHFARNPACKQHKETDYQRKEESNGRRAGSKKRFCSAEQTFLLNKYFLQHNTRSEAEYDHIAKHVSAVAGGKVSSPLPTPNSPCSHVPFDFIFVRRIICANGSVALALFVRVRRCNGASGC